MTGLTPYQGRRYAGLATAIADAIDSGRSIPCVRLPAFFDVSLAKPKIPADNDEDRANELARRRELVAIRAGMCEGCPVLEQCTKYASSGVQVHGFVAGSWRGE